MAEKDEHADRWMRTAWGKLENGVDLHALVCHAIDTAVVAQELYGVLLSPRIRTDLAEGLGPLGHDGDADKWAAFFCGLHDVGKLSPSFQAIQLEKARERFGPEADAALSAVAPDAVAGRWDTPHGVLTAVHLEQWLKGRGAAWDLRAPVVDLLGGHHGWIPDPDEVRTAASERRQLGDKRWRAARDRLVRVLADLWGLDLDGADWRGAFLSPRAAVGLAGLTIVSDWTASARPKSEYEPDPGSLPEYRDREFARVRALLEQLNWRAWRPPASPSHAGLFPDAPQPRPLQERVGALLSDVTEPGVLVIEGPTGEGKTKAGLQAAAVLVERLGLAGMYVATPTKAIARPAHAEVNRMLAATGAPLRAHLLYTGASADLERLAEERRDAQGPEADVGDLAFLLPHDVGRDHPGDQEAARKYFTGKKAALFPIGAGTIDQALKAAARSGHVALRLAALSNKVLVFDEIHSYDAYMSPQIDRLLWWCGHLGTPVVMMSATLTGPRRDELIAAWRAGATGRPLPQAAGDSTSSPPDGWCATWADARGLRRDRVGLSADNPRRHVTVRRIADDHDAIADEVLARLAEGGCAAVIHNTPARASKTQRRFESRGEQCSSAPELLYLDGKSDDRTRREVGRRLAELCGPGAAPGRRTVVVGTQVLEHGLDTDFDLLVSDPCPIDLLIQRLGRLHRHRRTGRPAAVAAPEVLVVQGAEPFRFPAYPTSAYARSHMLATEYELSQHDTITLPDDIPGLVHAVYVAEDRIPPGTLRTEWEGARTKRAVSEEMASFKGSLRLIPLFDGPSGLVDLTKRSAPPKIRRDSGPAEERARKRRKGGSR